MIDIYLQNVVCHFGGDSHLSRRAIAKTFLLRAGSYNGVHLSLPLCASEDRAIHSRELNSLHKVEPLRRDVLGVLQNVDA